MFMLRANAVDPDRPPHGAATDLVLHCSRMIQLCLNLCTSIYKYPCLSYVQTMWTLMGCGVRSGLASFACVLINTAFTYVHVCIHVYVMSKRCGLRLIAP